MLIYIKPMHLLTVINFSKFSSEIYKRMRLITGLYGIKLKDAFWGGVCSIRVLAKNDGDPYYEISVYEKSSAYPYTLYLAISHCNIMS